jgi:hypothetical protein
MVSLTSVTPGIKPDNGFHSHLRLGPLIWIAAPLKPGCGFEDVAFIGQICEEAGDMSESRIAVIGGAVLITSAIRIVTAPKLS